MRLLKFEENLFIFSKSDKDKILFLPFMHIQISPSDFFNLF